MTHTKIVATLGPSSQDAAVLERMVEVGANVLRLNFSHGTLEEHAASVETIRKVCRGDRGQVAILGDLCGPKIRIGPVPEGELAVEVGDMITVGREAGGGPRRLTTNDPEFLDQVEIGQRVLIDDGAVHFLVTTREDDYIVCTCTTGGVVRSRKGMNLPDTRLVMSSLTPFDWECVRWAIGQELDYLALSFVRSADDMHELRAFLEKEGGDMHLIAKIERPEAVEKIDAILDAADGLMIARGDLGVEMDVAEVPLIQKDLVIRCRDAGKPVIVATQMLQSMIESASPTRAEVSDVANAILDGTDAVMLSGETSVGAHPVLTVHTMARVVQKSEAYLRGRHDVESAALPGMSSKIPFGRIARGVRQMVHDLDVRLLAIWGDTGPVALLFSKLRLRVPILAFCSEPRVQRRMALYFGVVPVCAHHPQEPPALTRLIDATVVERRLAQRGDAIVIVGGSAGHAQGVLDGAVVHTVGG